MTTFNRAPRATRTRDRVKRTRCTKCFGPANEICRLEFLDPGIRQLDIISAIISDCHARIAGTNVKTTGKNEQTFLRGEKVELSFQRLN